MTETLASAYADEFVTVAGEQLRLRRGGVGDPMLILHSDIGNPGWLPFHQQLSESFEVLAPSHPGYDESSRPVWMRSVRDMAVLYQWLLADLQLERVTLVGLGFGGWLAAEMATMAPGAFKRLVLVGAMGLQPTDGEILDQSLVSYIDYARASFHSQQAFDQVYGSVPSTDQLEIWDINREMTFRVAWKPYLYSQTLRHLLGGVRAPALVVWGADDRVVPLSCGRRYVEALPQAQLAVIDACGHGVAMESPDELVRLIQRFDKS